MTAPTLRADDRDAWTRFLDALTARDRRNAGAAEALLRATWAAHERQQGIRR